MKMTIARIEGKTPRNYLLHLTYMRKNLKQLRLIIDGLCDIELFQGNRLQTTHHRYEWMRLESKKGKRETGKYERQRKNQ